MAVFVIIYLEATISLSNISLVIGSLIHHKYNNVPCAYTKIIKDTQKEYIQDKFKYITCNFDTVNYLEDFNKFISHCSKMQDEGGILIFDIVTEDIFDEIFEADIFLDEEENYTAIWTHKKEKKNRHRIDISIFKKEKSNIYTRYDEHHKKYIYEMEEVIDGLNNNGYVLYDVAKNPKYGYSRIFVIAKKE